MSGNEDIRQAEAQRWYVIVERDIRTAQHALVAEPPLVETAAYHCQQACEKLIKGCLAGDGLKFPYSHDLVELTALITKHRPELSGILSFLQMITPWGVAYRYPFEEEAQTPPTVEEIKKVLEKIVQLRSQIGGLK